MRAGPCGHGTGHGRTCRINWREHVERERGRYDEGMRRLDPEQLVRLGNAAYGAGLCLLMLGEREEAAEWLERASARWRESWEHATPTSWGRPIGVIKAALIAGDDHAAAAFAAWALGLGCADAESPIGRYAATLALLVEGRDTEAAGLAESLRVEPFPPEVADALVGISTSAEAQYRVAVQRVLTSFETRDEYLEDVPVADTVIVLQALARRRGLAAELDSPLLPG